MAALPEGGCRLPDLSFVNAYKNAGHSTGVTCLKSMGACPACFLKKFTEVIRIFKSEIKGDFLSRFFSIKQKPLCFHHNTLMNHRHRTFVVI